MRIVPFIAPLPKTITLTGKFGLLALLAGLGACTGINSLRSPVYTGSTNQARSSATRRPLRLATPMSVRARVFRAPTCRRLQAPPPTRDAAVPAAIFAAGHRIRARRPTHRRRRATPRMVRRRQSRSLPPPTRAASAARPPTTLDAEAARLASSGTGAAPMQTRGTVTHLVQPGDTAWNISQRYGITGQ